MIKSEIDARERALELAMPLGIELIKKGDPINMVSINMLSVADDIVKYLIGDAELPETQSDTELVKAFLEVMNSELDKKCKPMPDYSEMLKAVLKDNACVSAKMPCKSETE